MPAAGSSALVSGGTGDVGVGEATVEGAARPSMLGLPDGRWPPAPGCVQDAPGASLLRPARQLQFQQQHGHEADGALGGDQTGGRAVFDLRGLEVTSRPCRLCIVKGLVTI